MLICANLCASSDRGSGRLIKTQVLYEHTLSGHNPSGHRQAGTLRAQVIFLLFGSYARNGIINYKKEID